MTNTLYYIKAQRKISNKRKECWSCIHYGIKCYCIQCTDKKDQWKCSNPAFLYETVYLKRYPFSRNTFTIYEKDAFVFYSRKDARRTFEQFKEYRKKHRMNDSVRAKIRDIEIVEVKTTKIEELDW